MDRAEIIREKGTNRRHVLKGLVDKYTWHDIGSSFLPSDILAAVLYAQMERYDEIMEKRMDVWNAYHELLKPLEEEGKLRRPILPDHIAHNAHMYNIILPTSDIRNDLTTKLKECEIMAYICYVPLHSSPMGLKLGYTADSLPITEDLASRTLRLPLHADMTLRDAELVAKNISMSM